MHANYCWEILHVPAKECHTKCYFICDDRAENFTQKSFFIKNKLIITSLPLSHIALPRISLVVSITVCLQEMIRKYFSGIPALLIHVQSRKNCDFCDL